MRVVALTELHAALEVESAPLASILGLSPYDVKARLGGGVPCILLQTPDPELAKRVLQAVLARGHSAVECDAASAVPSAEMVKLHRFTLDARGQVRRGEPAPAVATGTSVDLVVQVLAEWLMHHRGSPYR